MIRAVVPGEVGARDVVDLWAAGPGRVTEPDEGAGGGITCTGRPDLAQQAPAVPVVGGAYRPGYQAPDQQQKQGDEAPPPAEDQLIPTAAGFIGTGDRVDERWATHDG